MEIINIQKCCRVCTSRNVQMMSIFEQYKYSERNLQVFEVITKCASVQIQKLDGFSEQICKECMEHLCQAFSFKLLCEDTDYKFRHNMIIGRTFESQNACCNELQSEVNEELQAISSVTKPQIKTEFNIEETKIQYGSVLEDQLQDDKSSINLITSHNLYDELRTQKIEFSNECEFCGQYFSEKSLLNNHKQIHAEELYKCEINHDTHPVDSSENTIFNHTEGENSDNSALITDFEERPHKCETCGKSFKEKGKLNVHNRIHTGEKPYKCEICDKSFTHQTAFLYHKKIHAGDKPYKCETCNKNFINHWTLRRHNKIHTGERPYTCETCGKCFSEISKLSIHKRIHTGEKPYKCEVCCKYFIRHSALKSHTLTHSGERPHKCETCGKCFKERKTLNIHMRIHTGEKPYICETCGKSFSQRTALMSHKKTHKSANE